MKVYTLLFALLALPASAQKLAPNALLAARQHQVSRAARVQTLAPSSSVSGFISVSTPQAIPQLEALGVKIRSNIADCILTATIPVGALEAAAALDGVERVELGEEVTPTMDIARSEAGADRVRSAVEGLDRAYKGKGVIVGVVDQGFEYSHLDFKAEDGVTPRILCAWNQTYQGGPAPSGYTYGTEYPSWSALANLDNDFLLSSYHGSHVAGIAAGADLTTPYYGVASESDLILVTYQSTADQIVDAVKYIFDKADALGRPCVVNLSIGMHTGPHDGTSLTDQALTALTGPGRILVGAVGNEGMNNMHVGKTVTPDNPLKVIPALYSAEQKNFICDFWGDSGKTFYMQPVVVNSLKGTIIAYGEKVSSEDNSSVESAFTMTTQGVEGGTVGLEGAVTVTSAPAPFNGCGNFYVTGYVEKQGTGRMLGLLITTDEEECEVNGWNCLFREFSASTSCQREGFTPGDGVSIASEIGGTGRGIISVGSYNSRLRYTNLQGQEYGLGGAGYTLSDLSPFSSKGPTIDGRMKPDVCAPGFSIISAAQRNAIKPSEAAAASTDAKGNRYYYEVNGGTSMASPYVTGSVALWLEAKPDLTPDDIRQILRSTSRRDDFTGTLGADDGALPEGNSHWGYGKIDTHGGLLFAANYDERISGLALPTTEGANLRCIIDRQSRRVVSVVADASVEVYTADGRLAARGTDLSALPSGTYIVRLKRGVASATQKVIL